MYADIFTTFTRILSGPVAFLASKFFNYLIYLGDVEAFDDGGTQTAFFRSRSWTM